MTNVVKMLSRELDAVEQRARDHLAEQSRQHASITQAHVTQIETLRLQLQHTQQTQQQQMQQLALMQAELTRRSGWTQAQQDHINAQVRLCVQGLTGEHASLQSRVGGGLQALDDRFSGTAKQVWGYMRHCTCRGAQARSIANHPAG